MSEKNVVVTSPTLVKLPVELVLLYTLYPVAPETVDQIKVILLEDAAVAVTFIGALSMVFPGGPKIDTIPGELLIVKPAFATATVKIPSVLMPLIGRV